MNTCQEATAAEGVTQPFLENWVKENRKRLVSLARRILGNHDDAEDAVQTLLCRLWRGRQRLANIKAIDYYLDVCVRNEARNFLRSKRIKLQALDVEEIVDNRTLQTMQDPTSSIQAAELASWLIVFQRRLSPAQQRLFQILQDDPEKSGRTLAMELGCSHKNVQGLLKRIRCKLNSITPKCTGAS